MDPQKEKQLLQWYNELDSDNDDALPRLKDESDDEIDELEKQNTDSDTELSAESDSDESIATAEYGEPLYIGKDKITKWKVHCEVKSNKTAAINKSPVRPGVKGFARNARSVSECWQLFFSDEMIAKIVSYTNVYLTHIRERISRPRDAADTDIDETKALFGLLYFAGTMKASHMNLNDLWDNACGPPVFRNTMSKNRFYLLLRALRFDDIRDRADRRTLDKLAPIRNIFESFVQKCMDHYEIGYLTTIDEMLEAFRGKCSFRQYIPSKPAKYGIKIYSIVDAGNWYTSKMEIYAGRQPEGPFRQDNSTPALVKRLIEPIANTNRNVTCDNFFTSIPLAIDLLKNYKTTLVGTLRKNKREIPPVFVATKDRPLNSSMFAFGKECLLVSYVPKKNKNVLVLSTMHKKDIIDIKSGNDCKPEVITFYNETKSGVDVVDKLKSLYTVSRISCRWPLTIFFTLMNIAGINSQIIYAQNTDIKCERRIFLRNICLELIRPHLLKRSKIATLPLSLRMNINTQLGISEEPVVEPSTSSTEKCAFCPKRKNRKTKVKCRIMSCSLPICGEHTITICKSCWEKKKADSD